MREPLTLLWRSDGEPHARWWLEYFPGAADPFDREWWPPLPKGRRPRALERARRARLVREQRSALLAVLVRRVRALLPPEPEHGPICSGGAEHCSECKAIQRWRDIRAVELEVCLRAYAEAQRKYAARKARP